LSLETPAFLVVGPLKERKCGKGGELHLEDLKKIRKS
jgi:hypothetical protein